MEESLAENLGYAENNAGYEAVEGRYSTEGLRSCLEELDEKDRELVVRRYYYEQKPAQIALALDMPKKQLRVF